MQQLRYIRSLTFSFVLLSASGSLAAQEAGKARMPANPDPNRNGFAQIAANASEAPVAQNTPSTREQEFQFGAFLRDPAYDSVEQIALWVVLGVAVVGLLYAGTLVGQVVGADQGTE